MASERPDEFRAADASGDGPRALRFEREGDRAQRIAIPAFTLERVEPFFRTDTMIVVAALALLTAVASVIGFFAGCGERSRPAARNWPADFKSPQPSCGSPRSDASPHGAFRRRTS